MTIIPIEGTQEDQRSLFFEIFEHAQEGGRLSYNGVVRTVRRMWNTDRFRTVFGAAAQGNCQPVQFFLSLARRLCDRRILEDDFDAAIELSLMERSIEETAPLVEEAPLPQRGMTVQSSVQRPILVKDLVLEMRGRTWSDRIRINTRSGSGIVRGYLPADREADQKRLERLIEEHNALFSYRMNVGAAQTTVGYIERLDLVPPRGLESGDTLYVRADIHSDLATLLAQLEMHKRDGDMDGDFRCRPGFHILFLGDYLDRGANDIEVLTVLLSLHMANPVSVHLLRGNHEDLIMASEFSTEAVWMEQHADAFAALYRSLPFAVCAGVQGQKAQYVHCSHGLFPTWMRLGPLLEAGSPRYLAVPHQESTQGAPPGKVPEEDIGLWRRMSALCRLDRTATGYLWSDVRQKTGPLERSNCEDSELGCSLSPEDIYAYGQVAGEQAGTLEAFVRGHEHIAREWTVCRKGGTEGVLVTTLPTGTIGGMLGLIVGMQRTQGIFFTPSQFVRDWTKKLSIMEGDGPTARLVKGEGSYRMFSRMFPHPAP